jgi:hypothetical protein
MKEDTFDQVTDALVYFSNEINENDDRSIVFNVVGNEPKYFRFLASKGEITFDFFPGEKILISPDHLLYSDWPFYLLIGAVKKQN